MSGHKFSVEAIILGRNDEYEPNWQQKLFASITYNRARFEGSGVDYRVVFVEWNPPRDRPLMAPGLVSKFPFLRAIAVDADVHDALCTSPALNMMLNFSLNSAIRTSKSDFCLISAGDLFFGQALADYIKNVGLNYNCLYRAERVNIRNDIDFTNATPAEIEDPANVVSVNSCTEPPYDKPPYTHACGDFLLVDRLTMAGLRGFDEGIRYARMHLDSRFCKTAMHAGLDCKLIGQIFHINHSKSYQVMGATYPDLIYDYEANLPYVNARNWGLADHVWTSAGDRTWRVSRPQPDTGQGIPEHFSRIDKESANEVTGRIISVRDETILDRPDEDATVLTTIDPASLRVSREWKGARIAGSSPTVIDTVADAWGYSATSSLSEFSASANGESGRPVFLEVVAEVQSGAIGVGLLQDNAFTSERIQHETRGLERTILRVPPGEVRLIIRNARAQHGASRAAIHGIRLLKANPRRNSGDQLLELDAQ